MTHFGSFSTSSLAFFSGGSSSCAKFLFFMAFKRSLRFNASSSMCPIFAMIRNSLSLTMFLSSKCFQTWIADDVRGAVRFTRLIFKLEDSNRPPP